MSAPSHKPTDQVVPHLQRWKCVPKKYFPDDPEKQCFVEEDASCAGSPLWPVDANFDPEIVTKQIQSVHQKITPHGGSAFGAHVSLKPDRSVPEGRLELQSEAQQLSTTFISGFHVPREMIQECRMGYTPSQGTIPGLSETAKTLDGTWLLTNLGYFLTRRLIVSPEEGGLQFSNNARLPHNQHLQPDDLMYLGGFVDRKTGAEPAGFPPLFQTAGVAIDDQSQPHLISKTELRGGSVYFDGVAVQWSAADVDLTLADQRDVIVYTPRFSTSSTKQAIVSGRWKEYKLSIGAERINVLIINRGTGKRPEPCVAYVVDGEIVQPSAGIVLSMRRDFFLEKFKINANWKKMQVKFDFEPWFEPALWQKLQTCYQGIMDLDRLSRYGLEDWEHPNSSLTQETLIANLYRREPRSALFETKNGFGAIVFSGRYEMSLGISLIEMKAYIEKFLAIFLPNLPIERVVSLDGGSGAKICLIDQGKVQALNWAAPGSRNQMGDPNGNTYSYMAMRLPA